MLDIKTSRSSGSSSSSSPPSAVAPAVSSPQHRHFTTTTTTTSSLIVNHPSTNTITTATTNDHVMRIRNGSRRRTKHAYHTYSAIVTRITLGLVLIALVGIQAFFYHKRKQVSTITTTTSSSSKRSSGGGLRGGDPWISEASQPFVSCEKERRMIRERFYSLLNDLFSLLFNSLAVLFRYPLSSRMTKVWHNKQHI